MSLHWRGRTLHQHGGHKRVSTMHAIQGFLRPSRHGLGLLTRDATRHGQASCRLPLCCLNIEPHDAWCTYSISLALRWEDSLPLSSPLGRGNSCHPRYQHSCHGPHFFSVWKLFLFCSNWTVLQSFLPFQPTCPICWQRSRGVAPATRFEPGDPKRVLL